MAERVRSIISGNLQTKIAARRPTTEQREPVDPHIFLLRQPILQIEDWRKLLQGHNAAHVALKLAQKGSPKAQYALGKILLHGQGVPEDREEAFAWFGLAAAQEYAPAMNMVGRCYENGWGCQKTPVEAFYWFEKAAALGDDWAMFNLADLLRRGEGAVQNDERAFSLYQQAADKGHVKSLNMLGLFFEDGRGTRKDLQSAAELYQRGAVGGDCWAHFNFARLLSADGKVDEALHWLELSLKHQIGDYCATLAELFQQHPDVRLRSVSEKALALLNQGR
ncbi:tetratricopeptide repeat protein [Bartonella sp. LJL80]